MTVDVDFTKGAVNSFAASGNPTYDSNGASFTVASGGQSPQLTSLFYIMFGRVEITMKAAPGAGIVSSLVLESDDLDEIDMEWLGAEPDQMQSNYFGKGQTTTYNRGEFHNVQGTQSDWITYTVDWTQDRIVWMVAGTTVRTLTAGDAEQNQYPQTPMQVKFGSWSGGDPNYNPPGTVAWAHGPTVYSNGPFSMMVQKVVVTDYSTGKQYKYQGTTGTWQSIQAVGGSVNGNINNAGAVTATASAAGSTATDNFSIPVGGIASDKGSSQTATQTGWPWNAGTNPTSGAIPSGWYLTPDGKIKPDSDTSDSNSGSVYSKTPHVVVILGSTLLGAVAYMARLW